MKKIAIILTLLTVVSCDITKQASKSKTDTDFKEAFEKIEKRDGGTATYIAQPNIIYRDTTRIIQGTNGTQLKIIYDKQGIIQQADCNAALIDVITKYSSQLEQSVKEKEKTKTEKLNTDWILYIAGGFVLIVSIGFYLTFKTINKNAAVLTAVLEQLKAR